MLTIIFDTGYALGVKLRNNDFVERWSELLEREIARNSLLQEHTYSSFVSEFQARQYLEQAIDTVNKFLKHQVVSLPTTDDYDNPDFYNKLHSQFERLAGPDWEKPTRLMCIAPEPVRLAIKSINRWCHRLERRPYQKFSSFRLEFDTDQRQPLLANDYDLFEPITEPNTVTLDYSTLGKSLRECFADNQVPTYAGMKLQHHYAANFILNTKVNHHQDTEFLKWCNAHNIDPVPRSETGSIILGQIADPNWYNEVTKTCKIQSIILE